MISIFPAFIYQPIYEIKEGDFIRFGRNRAGIAIPYQQYGSIRKQMYIFDLNTFELTTLESVQLENPYILKLSAEYDIEIEYKACFSSDANEVTGGELVVVNHGENTEYAIATNPNGKEELVTFTFSGRKIRLHQVHATLIDKWNISVQQDKNSRSYLYGRGNELS